jgi:hypothetical protein
MKTFIPIDVIETNQIGKMALSAILVKQSHLFIFIYFEMCFKTGTMRSFGNEATGSSRRN